MIKRDSPEIAQAKRLKKTMDAMGQVFGDESGGVEANQLTITDAQAIMARNNHLLLALRVIRDMPISEQDSMLSANMRKVAAEAIGEIAP